jgi:hypothetical protein
VEAQFANGKTLVEGVIKGLGVDPAACRAKEGTDETSWTLQRGSAAVLITLSKRPQDGGVYVRVVSPVMTLPEAGKREALYKHLLELNAAGLANAAFGLVGERVVVVSERPTPDMQADELSQMIRHLAAVADTYDDRLVKAFGGRLAADKA